MRLAVLAGILVAPVKLVKFAGKDVLLIECFDRVQSEHGWLRKSMVSVFTMFGLNDMTARYACYQDFAKIIRYRFSDPKNTLKEMFACLVFNVLKRAINPCEGLEGILVVRGKRHEIYLVFLDCEVWRCALVKKKCS